MERTISIEEKIRRAEEIYNRRRGSINNYSARVNVNDKKDYKLFKKMVWQIIICLSIYGCYYAINNNNSIFSEDIINKTKEILSYDINFSEIYTICKNYIIQGYNEEKTNNNIENNIKTEENKEDTNNISEETQNTLSESKVEEIQNIPEQDKNIGGAETKQVQTTNEITKEKEISQEEQDIIDIKNKINFIKPIEGTISSVFGWRNPTTSTVPKYHTGLDIAAATGTVIKSATDGTVSLASSEGDYRKSFKNN